MTEKQGLSARQLLKGVYISLKDELGGKEIKLPSKAKAEIANDSDWHRTRIGYIGYEIAMLLKANGKEWTVAFGTKRGRSYLVRPYNCDIAAVPVSTNGKSNEEIAKEIHKALEGGSYFHNSLIYAMADGQLAINEDGQFGQKVLELLMSRVQGFVAQDLETDSRYFTMDLQPVVKSAVQYKPEFVVFLRDTVCTVLAS